MKYKRLQMHSFRTILKYITIFILKQFMFKEVCNSLWNTCVFCIIASLKSSIYRAVFLFPKKPHIPAGNLPFFQTIMSSRENWHTYVYCSPVLLLVMICFSIIQHLPLCCENINCIKFY